MKMGWLLYRLNEMMKKGVVAFLYKKVNGQFRLANGTTSDIDYRPKGRKATDNVGTLTYYDVDRKGFRSFRIENLVAIY